MITSRERIGRSLVSAFLLSAATAAYSAQILVPAYFYPGPNWETLITSASQVGIVAVANPNSGVGDAVDSNYTDVIKRLKAAGGRTIGYVSTRYAARPISEVKAEVDTWMSWYGDISGIFFDEMTNDDNADHIKYYKDLHAYVNNTYSTKSFVVTNPGGSIPEKYYTNNCADTFVIFENSTGFGTWTASTWVKPKANNRFAVIPYNVGSRKVDSFADRAKTEGVGYIYITNDSGDNPWDTLPSYWSSLVEKVKTL